MNIENNQHNMTQNSTSKFWLWSSYSRLGLIVAFIALVADQLHKWWMLTIVGITRADRIEVTEFFNLVYVSNKGISFGMLQQDGNGQMFLAAFSFAVAIALIIWLFYYVDSALLAIATGLIVGGAIGNAIDRLYLGGVADFFDFHIFGYHWPAFNIADISIVTGVIGLLYDAFNSSRDSHAKKA